MSENAKHTPGPWMVVEAGTNRSIHPEPRDGLAIAQVSWERDSEADARLIAAAPDQNRELKAMSEFFGRVVHMNGHSWHEDDLAEAKGRLSAARAAIAKAEGTD